MKINRISFLIILSISLCSVTFAQAGNDTCPKITIISQNKTLTPFELSLITAEIAEENKKSKFGYSWTVSKGIIEMGQGTAQIYFSPSPADSDSTATVTVKITGLSKTCSDTVSETFVIKAPRPIADPDTFGKISLNEYRARLDSLFIVVRQESPNSEAVLTLRFDKKDRHSYRISRLKNISKLITALKFDKAHFSFIIFEGDSEESTFWIIPPGMDYPTIENSTVIKAEELNQKLNKLFPIK